MRLLSRLRPAIAVAILSYAALIGLTGGFDVAVGPIRIRSHHTDWLLQLAAIAALADLVFRDNLIAHLRTIARRLRTRIPFWRPAITRAALVLVTASVALYLITLLVTLTPAEVPSGDMALLEIYTRSAVAGDALLGPYSRFQWNHPGPSMFYLLAPLYALSGGSFESLRASALFFNIVCLVGLLVVVRRRGQPALLVSVSGALALLLLRAKDMLVSPWNPHLLVLPLGLLIVSCAAVADGALALALVMIVLSSFLIQTHLSIAPAVAAVFLATVSVVALRVSGREEAARCRRTLNASLWVAIGMWFLPLAEEVTSVRGNLSAIYQFFTDPYYVLDHRASYAAFFKMLTGFLLPGFGTAWGGNVVDAVSVPASVLSLTLLIALPWVAAAFRKRGDRFTADLTLFLLVASLAALWSFGRIRGEVLDMLVFWVAIIGALIASVVAGRLIPDKKLSQRVAHAVAVAVVCVVASVGLVELLRTNRPAYDTAAADRVRNGTAAISSYLQREGLRHPVVHIAHPAWGDAAGVVLQLEKSGTDVSIEREWLYMFGRMFAADGTEDSELVIGDGSRRLSLSDAESYAVLAEWPELTILARPRARSIDR